MVELQKTNPNISSRQDSILQRIRKWDGWENIFTGLGVYGKDKRMGATPVPHFFTQQEVENIYQIDDIAARIVDRLPEEMTREGFELSIDGSEDYRTEWIEDQYKHFGLHKKIEECLKWSRIYGGSALIIGVRGQSMEVPLDLNAIPVIDYFGAIDRWRLIPSGELISDLASPNFGNPVYYQLNNPEVTTAQSFNQKIHYSRIIRFDGVRLPWRLYQQNNYWGDSIFSRIYNAVRNYQSVHDSAATIVQDFTHMVFKMKELSSILAQGKDDLVMKRFALASRLSSIVNATVVQDGEDVDRKTTNVAGLSDVVKIVNERLVAATDMPHTVLLGQSPSGLGASGDSEKRDWYDHIKNKQESDLRPIDEKIIELLFSQKMGITKGVIPKYELNYVPLWQMDDKQKVEIRKIQSETDTNYINAQVLDPEEVAKSRFAETGYSIDTAIDWETRKLLESKDLTIEESPESQNIQEVSENENGNEE